MMTSKENAALIASLQNQPALSGDTPVEWREQLEAMFRDFPYAENVHREPFRLNHEVDGEWFRYGDRDGSIILYTHGGGYMLGSTRSHGALIANLAAASGIDALGVNYRLAPEHPFPCGLEDMVQAYQHLLTIGYSSERIAIVGDSAGAGLAAALLLTIRDRGLPRPACGVLISGWYDLSCGAPSLERNRSSDPLVVPGVLDVLANAYTGSGEARQNPLASPLFANPSNLPPLLIQASTCEVLADDSVLFADRARSAGVPVVLDMVKEMVHVWHQFAHLIPEGREAIERAGSFIRSHVVECG